MGIKNLHVAVLAVAIGVVALPVHAHAERVLSVREAKSLTLYSLVHAFPRKAPVAHRRVVVRPVAARASAIRKASHLTNVRKGSSIINSGVYHRPSARKPR